MGCLVPEWLIDLRLIVIYPVCVADDIIDAALSAYRKHKQKKPRCALTLPLPESPSPWYRKCRRQKTFDQSQSPFFRLPLELREMIYHQVIVPSDGADIHMSMTGNRLYSILCSESDPSREECGITAAGNQ